MLEHVLV